MHERIAQHAEDISRAAIAAREVQAMAESLARNAQSLAEAAKAAVDHVHKTSIDPRTIDHLESEFADQKQRADSLKEAEERAAETQAALQKRSDDLDAREAELADREAKLPAPLAEAGADKTEDADAGEHD